MVNAQAHQSPPHDEPLINFCAMNIEIRELGALKCAEFTINDLTIGVLNAGVFGG